MTSTYQLHDLSLAFDDPSLESRWQSENFGRSLNQVRVAAVVGVAVLVSYGAADPVILPEDLASVSLWAPRFAGASVIGLIFLSSFFRIFERIWQWLLVAGAMAVVGSLTWMWLILNASVYWYYHTGLVLILIYVFLLLRLTFRFAVLTGALTMVVFVSMAIFVRPDPEINLVTGASLMFVLLMGIFTSYVLESNERTLYKQTLTIKKQRSELQSSLEQLEMTQRHLIQAEKMASLGQLSAGLAHELRNPLNFVSNFVDLSAEMLEDLRSPDGRVDYTETVLDLKQNLERVLRHTARANEIIRRLIEHADAVGRSIEPADVNDVVKAAVEAVKIQFTGKIGKEMPTIRRDYHQAPLHFPMVKRDIMRVVQNLLENAIQSVLEQSLDTGQPGGLVSIRTDRNDEWITIRVTDTGTGISEETRDHIFEPFFTTRAPGQGAGLGLFLAYQVVSGHGGTIEMNSKVGSGSWFEIKLPIREAVE